MHYFVKAAIDASYPSGHAARAMIIAIILGYALSERFPRGAYLLFLYPVMISISRIYVLQHYPYGCHWRGRYWNIAFWSDGKENKTLPNFR